MTVTEAMAIADRYDRQLRELEEKEIKRLNRALDNAYNQLERELARKYQNLVNNKSLLASQRKILILQELGDLLKIVTGSEVYEARFASLIKQASEAGFEVAGLLTQALGNEELKPFTDIPIEAIAASARGTYQRLLRYGDVFADNATNIISTGIAQGWGVGRINPPLRQQLGVTRQRAEMLARTESITAYSEAAEQRYIDAGIEGILWIAIGDRRTCAYCLARHLKVYPRGSMMSPLHPYCRCTRAPWQESWREAGIIDVDTLARLRTEAIAAAGVTPLNQPAPFEKAAGVKALPTPIFDPTA